VGQLTGHGPTLPRILLSVRYHLPRSPHHDAGVLFHDLSLSELIHLSAGVDRPRAVDLDTVEGMTPDAAALAFLSDRLGIKIVITRRPALALRALDLGFLPLLRIHCLDSTGFERALEGHPGPPVGTAVSPGLILAHMSPGQRARLPEPIVANGLMRKQEDVAAALAAGAAAVVLEEASRP
jgi:glycerol-3-phosphate responsive antiterminator